jgi:hypothetical protein
MAKPLEVVRELVGIGEEVSSERSSTTWIVGR